MDDTDQKIEGVDTVSRKYHWPAAVDDAQENGVYEVTCGQWNKQQPNKGMMNKHDGCKRRFVHLARAWYGEANGIFNSGEPGDSISIGFDHPDGGSTGEFSIEWMWVGRDICPQLKVFDDGWDALWEFRDALEKMAALDGTNPGPEIICKLLESCGIEDTTPVKDPNRPISWQFIP